MNKGDFNIDLIVSSTVPRYDEDTGSTILVAQRRYIPLTAYRQGESSRWATYDENLSIKNNSQYTLTFSINKFVDGQVHPLFYMIVENRRLRLTEYNRVLDFIITGITPKITKNNVVYSVTCQDSFSFDMSKQNISLDYISDVPRNIRDHADEILKLSRMSSRYEIDNNLERTNYVKFPNLATTSMIEWANTTNTTMEVTQSTPYNLFVKLAEQYNAIINVTYPVNGTEKAIINFDNQELIRYKGYALRPEVNLTNFSISRKSDSFCSILHMNGGETADGSPVSLLPTIPTVVQDFLLTPVDKDKPEEDWTKKTSSELQLLFKEYAETNKLNSDTLEIQQFFFALTNIVKSGGNFLYNFDYFRKAHLMDSLTYDELLKTMNIDMRNSNLLYNCYNTKYNRALSQFTLWETEMEDYIHFMAAEYENQYQVWKKASTGASLDIVALQKSINTIYEYKGYYDNNFEIHTLSSQEWSGLGKIWFQASDGSHPFILTLYNLFGHTGGRSNYIDDKAKTGDGNEGYWAQKRKEYKNLYDDYIKRASDLLKVFVDSHGTRPADYQTDEEWFASTEKVEGSYSEYCYLKDLADNAAMYIDIESDEFDKPYYIMKTTEENDGMRSLILQPNGKYKFIKKGICTLWIEELQKLQSLILNDFKLSMTRYTNSTVNLSKEIVTAQTNLNNSWDKLYSTYGDFICESSYTDETQLTSEGLYIAAQRQMALYGNPTIDYNTTIINLDKIVNVYDSEIQLGDIVRFYSPDLYEQYSGNIIFEIAKTDYLSHAQLTHTVGQISIENNATIATTKDKTLDDYPITKVVQRPHSTLVHVQAPVEQVEHLLHCPATLKIDGTSYAILSKQLDSIVQPVDLQVTGISTKLRESTTQLTVSNNRTIQNLLGRLLRPVK